MTRTAIPRVLGGLIAILVLAAGALAQQVHEIVPGGDAVSGTVSAPDEVERLPIRLPVGAVFSLSLKAAKGSTLLPELVILGTDRQPDVAVGAYLKANSKGNVLSVKNMPIPTTGMRWIEIRGKSGTTGGWLLSTKVKLPKGAAGSPAVDKAQGTTAFEFNAPGNAIATVTVAAAKGSAAFPAYGGITDPSGAAVIVDEVLPGKSGFSIKNVVLGPAGAFTLTLLPGSGGDGPATVTIKWKVPKPLKRALLESQVITDPVALSVSPDAGDNSQVVPVAIAVAFARPGAKVVFRKPPTVITAQGASLNVGTSGITFTQSFASFQQGLYDVEIENADGGKAVLAKAFSMVNAPATLFNVNPVFGYDNQTAVAVTVSGSFINGSATATLVHGGETISGTGVIAVSNSLTGSFNLSGHSIGYYDVVVTNPDAAAATLPQAFEIRNAPPVLTSIAPADNLSSLVVNCSLTGSDIDAPPTVKLKRTGQSDIAGTAVVRVSGSLVTCTFDTTGKAVGAWDVVLANPDGLFSTLTGAFSISGPVAPAAKSFAPANTADGPPALVWNATRNEFLVGWIDENTGSYDAWIQRLDPTGAPLGSKVAVSGSSSTVAKRDLSLSWSSTRDEYMAVWCEPRTMPTVATSHPSYGYSTVAQVFSQRFQGSDASATGNPVQITNHAPLAISPGYYMDEFNNYRPDGCWDPKNSRWQIVWMQEWSSRNVGNYGYDDWDVLQQTLDPQAGTILSNPLGIATTPNHEGDPSVVYNPVTQGITVAWNYRATLTGVLSGVVSAATVASDSVDTKDMRLAVDPDAGRLLVTWTKVPTSGAKYVQGVTTGLASTGSPIGAITTIGSGTEDHFLARPSYNSTLKQGLVAWTRKDGSGTLVVRSRRVTTGTSSGLVLIGIEQDTAAGATDEATPVTVFSGTNGESVVLFLRTMSFATDSTFNGATLPGVYRGREFWILRYR